MYSKFIKENLTQEEHAELIQIARKHNILGGEYLITDCVTNILIHKNKEYCEDAFDFLISRNKHLSNYQIEKFCDEICPEWREL